MCGHQNSQRGLIYHYRVKHLIYKGRTAITCFHPNCNRSFKTFPSLHLHVHREHRIHKANKVRDNCAYQCVLCQKKYCSSKQLLHHLHQHLKKSEVVSCPFARCFYSCQNTHTFRTHLHRRHARLGSKTFKSNVTVENETANVTQDRESDSDLEQDIDNSDIDEANVQKKDLKANVGLFLLQLQAIYQVPVKTIQEILTNINAIHDLSKAKIIESVSTVGLKYDIDSTICEEIAHEVHQNYPFYNITKLDGNQSGELSTSFRRKKFVKENLPLVEPIEYELGYRDGKLRTFCYIPIISVLRKLLSKNEVLNFVFDANNANDHNTYVNFKSGKFYKENYFYLNEIFSVIISLYQDDFEVANPLGTSKKIHKICGIYWVLLNIPYKYRSALHMIQAVILCRSIDIKHFGYSVVLRPLLRDLAQLETEGVFADLIGKEIKGYLAYIAADNLGAHSIGGYLECFSSNVKYFCRFCLITSDDLQDIWKLNPHAFTLRTKYLHEQHVASLMTEPKPTSVCGIKSDSVLNKKLSHFHVSNGLPPDIAHDLLEGIIPYELALCFSYFVQEKYLKLIDINEAIVNFVYVGKDAVNKPQKIPINFKNKKSIGGNATENRTLLRLLPLLIGEKIPVNEPKWELVLLLKEITQLCFAPLLCEADVLYLELKISSHLELFKECFPAQNFKPKHHFIQHYPHLISCYGPLLQCCTIRFEGKHKYFKSVVKRAQCFKNICKTLSEQHQLAQAFYLAGSQICKPHIEYFSSDRFMVQNLSDIQLICLRNYFQCLLNLLETKHLLIDSVKFVPGLFLVCDKDILPKFGRIEHILLENGKPYFLVEVYEAALYEHYLDYVIQRSVGVTVVQLEECLDCFPLTSYKIGPNEFIPLRHWLSLGD